MGNILPVLQKLVFSQELEFITSVQALTVRTKGTKSYGVASLVKIPFLSTLWFRIPCCVHSKSLTIDSVAQGHSRPPICHKLVSVVACNTKIDYTAESFVSARRSQTVQWGQENCLGRLWDAKCHWSKAREYSWQHSCGPSCK